MLVAQHCTWPLQPDERHLGNFGVCVCVAQVVKKAGMPWGLGIRGGSFVFLFSRVYQHAFETGYAPVIVDQHW